MTQLTLLLLAQLFDDLINIEEVIPFRALTAKWDATFCPKEKRKGIKDYIVIYQVQFA